MGRFQAPEKVTCQPRHLKKLLWTKGSGTLWKLTIDSSSSNRFPRASHCERANGSSLRKQSNDYSRLSGDRKHRAVWFKRPSTTFQVQWRNSGVRFGGERGHRVVARVRQAP